MTRPAAVRAQCEQVQLRSARTAREINADARREVFGPSVSRKTARIAARRSCRSAGAGEDQQIRRADRRLRLTSGSSARRARISRPWPEGRGLVCRLVNWRCATKQHHAAACGPHPQYPRHASQHETGTQQDRRIQARKRTIITLGLVSGCRLCSKAQPRGERNPATELAEGTRLGPRADTSTRPDSLAASQQDRLDSCPSVTLVQE